MQACFIGHRDIQNKKEVAMLLKEAVLKLINKGVDTFLFGSMSDFNELSWEIVTEQKKKFPFIKRVYVRSAYQFIDSSYENYLLESYEKTYFPYRIEKAGKASYVERNYEMIDNSSFCVFYYDKEYAVQLNQSNGRNSGTKIAYEYAVKKKKTIINLCKSL